MQTRRSLILGAAAALMALSVVILPALADELFGVLTKVDPDSKMLTVVEKDTDKEVMIKTTDDTEVVTGKGSSKIDLEKLAKGVAKIQDAGKKGMPVVVTHENKVASKIKTAGKKKAD